MNFHRDPGKSSIYYVPLCCLFDNLFHSPRNLVGQISRLTNHSNPLSLTTARENFTRLKCRLKRRRGEHPCEHARIYMPLLEKLSWIPFKHHTHTRVTSQQAKRGGLYGAHEVGNCLGRRRRPNELTTSSPLRFYCASNGVNPEAFSLTAVVHHGT